MWVTVQIQTPLIEFGVSYNAWLPNYQSDARRNRNKTKQMVSRIPSTHTIISSQCTFFRTKRKPLVWYQGISDKAAQQTTLDCITMYTKYTVQLSQLLTSKDVSCSFKTDVDKTSCCCQKKKKKKSVKYYRHQTTNWWLHQNSTLYIHWYMPLFLSW